VTQSRGPSLPPALVERLSQRDVRAHLGVGLPFVTVDEEGRPHPMLLSYLELRAYDAGSLGLVIQRTSRSARNLAARGTAIILISPELEEVLGLAHRIAVFSQGRMAGILSRAEATPTRILQMAIGGAKGTQESTRAA